MVFSSVIFLFWFLPIFLGLYLLAAPRYKNGLILGASAFFYAWGAPVFVFVFLGTTLLDFHLVRAMHRAPDVRKRKQWLVLSLILNLGLLAGLKYCNFFVGNLNGLLTALGSGPIPWTDVVLPLGISFFIFESLTYVIDVYRGVHPPLERFWDYQMYILLFPKLIAGPIVRYHDIADQISSRQESSDLFLTGMYRFVIGLAKKVLIADRLAAAAAPFFHSDPELLSAGQAWLGITLAGLQLYFDFSGYSDMALGLGRMMGFRFPENFNNPFIAGSLTEFWQRWHISLGNWMRNYLYIPLGGNRVAPLKVYRNLWIVFLACGFWHGAGWNFILWGAFHGAILVLERIFLGKWLAKLGRIVGMIYLAFIYQLLFVLFHIEDIGRAFRFYGAMFAFREGVPHTPLPEVWWIFGIALVLIWVAAIRPVQKAQDWLYAERQGVAGHLTLFSIAVLLLVLCSSYIAWSPHNPFLYFRF